MGSGWAETKLSVAGAPAFLRGGSLVRVRLDAAMTKYISTSVIIISVDLRVMDREVMTVLMQLY